MASPFAGLPFSVPPQYQPFVLMSSARWGIPANVLASQIQQESGYDPTATSSAGAEGIAQFEPGTAASLGVNPWNPASAIDGMARLDAQYVRQFGSIDLALAAYNAGPGSIVNGQIPQNGQTPAYVSKILQMASQAGPTGASVTSGLSGTDTGGSSFPAVGSLLSNLDSSSFWGRIGKGAIAGAVILGGVYFMMEKRPGSFAPVKELVNVK